MTNEIKNSINKYFMAKAMWNEMYHDIDIRLEMEKQMNYWHLQADSKLMAQGFTSLQRDEIFENWN